MGIEINNLLRRLDFSRQLTLVFIVGVIVLAVVTSLVVSKISSDSVRAQLLDHGRHITKSFADQSYLSLLYRSVDNAEKAVEVTLGYQDVVAVGIYLPDGEPLLEQGETRHLQGLVSIKAEKYLPGMVDNKDSQEVWEFVVPVFSGQNESDELSPFEDVNLEPQLEGYVSVVVSKQSLQQISSDILQGNMLVSLSVAVLLLLLLLALARRVTSPLEQLSGIMRRAESGEKNLRAEIRGPKDIINMQHAFNTMMAVLERRELELLETKDAALESARVKGEFAANVSHELRTPMNAVLGMLDLLMTMGLTPKQNEYVETAKSSGEVLLELIDDVLNFSKVESGVVTLDKEDCYIEDLLDEVIGLMSSHALRRKIDLGYVCSNDVPPLVSVDAAKIRQVLINLVGNAIKFTEQGEVAVRLDVLSSDEELTVLRFEVRDSGIGIAADAQNKIFEAFTQADSSTTRKYGGTGLGLAISRRIVELMGGEICISSVLGEGSTFWFTIPIKHDDIISNTDKLQRQPHEFADLQILTIDDSEIITDFMASHFKSWGINCASAADGLKGLEMLRSSMASANPFNLVILDEEVSGLKGIDFIKLLASDTFADRVQVIMLTSPWSEFQRLYPAEIIKLAKPLRSGSLFETLRKAVGAVSEESTEAVKSAKSTVASGPLNKRILVADDNRANQQVAVGMLERLGCEVTVAESGAEAIEAILRNAFDLILMDCQMPVMDGYEATGRIRKLEGDTANTPIIAMTANDNAVEKQRCRSAGMDDFLAKPLRLDELKAKLESWLKVSAVEEQAKLPSLPQGDVYQHSLRFDPSVIVELRESVGEVVDSMIEAFLEDTPVYLQSLKNAVAEGDAKQVRELAHTVKGSASNFGALEVVALSREIEEMGRKGELSGLADKMPELMTSFQQLCVDLESELSGHQLVGAAKDRRGDRYTILIADDDRSMRMALRNSLEADNYAIEEVQNGSHALAICQRKMPDLILMDALMPEVNGFVACRQIRNLANGADIPILMITALDDEESITHAFEAGASDYIPKPVHFSVMRQRVSRLLKASKVEKHVKKLAYHDPLTDLPNRASLMQQLRLMINRASLNKEMVAVLFLDLDRFKLINDSLGHDAGDLLLKAVAERIKGCLREQDFVARLGGDEFTVVLEGIDSPELAGKVAQKICDSLSRPFAFLQQKMFVTTSIGISLFPGDGEDVTSLLKHADSAMFSAKDKGNSYSFYEQGMEDEIARRLELERELRHALENDELVLHYQPQLDARTGKVVSAEALVRWQHPRHGLLFPGRFIPLAEESDLINELGRWVLQAACKQIQEWADRSVPLRVAVNFSGRELQGRSLVEGLGPLMQKYSVPPELLELEITESMLLEHHDQIVDDLNRIKSMGITLAIDDFGSGYSSLNYLKRLPVDVLKIDRVFVNDLDGDEEGQAIVGGIVALAKSLGLTTVAEGVETEIQQQILTDLGCDLLQGFYFDKAIPPKEFESQYLSVMDMAE